MRRLPTARPDLQPVSRGRLRRRVRAMTLVEMAVVIAVMALVMAFTVPRLVGADALGADQQAKTTASGVLDTISLMHAEDAARTGWDNGPVDEYLAALDPGAPDPEEPDLPHQPRPPQVGKSVVEQANPDVNLTPTPAQQAAFGAEPVPAVAAGRMPSTDVTVASVAVSQHAGGDSSTFWTVGVAVLAANSAGSGGACWLAQRRLDGPPGTPMETYYLFDFDDHDPNWAGPIDPDGDQCTGELATLLDFHQVRSGQVDPAAASSAGRSWGFPLLVSPEQVTATLTS